MCIRDRYIDDVEKEILAYINRDELPEALEQVVAKRVMGQLIEHYTLYYSPQAYYKAYPGSSGELESKADPKITNIKIGDVSTSFAPIDSKEEMQYFEDMKAKIKELKEYGEKQINRYRRISWW